MLGQSKSGYQAEIDAAAELIDFLRFNVHFGRRLLRRAAADSAPGVWNRMDHRPLEGFVLAITPFNFTAIAANLPLAPALMGNTVVWKPSPTQQLAAHHTMRLLEAAGLPPGVVNMVTGDGHAVSEVALAASGSLAGVHFTGSTGTFRHLWATVGAGLERYRGYPRLVGETGGKDFVVAHPSAEPDGARHRAGPRRVRVPGAEVLGRLPGVRAALPLGRRRPRRAGPGRPSRSEYGDVTDLSVFGGAVIDRRAFERLAARPRPGRRRTRTPRCSPAAGPTTPTASSSSRRW